MTTRRLKRLWSRSARSRSGGHPPAEQGKAARIRSSRSPRQSQGANVCTGRSGDRVDFCFALADGHLAGLFTGIEDFSHFQPLGGTSAFLFTPSCTRYFRAARKTAAFCRPVARPASPPRAFPQVPHSPLPWTPAEPEIACWLAPTTEAARTGTRDGRGLVRPRPPVRRIPPRAGQPINALTGKMVLRFFVVGATAQ